jgi:hypothetical protein
MVHHPSTRAKLCAEASLREKFITILGEGTTALPREIAIFLYKSDRMSICVSVEKVLFCLFLILNLEWGG